MVSKLAFLEYILRLNRMGWWVCPLHIIRRFGLDEKAASMRLFRYHQQGLLRRRRSRYPYRIYEYSISERGLERIEYYRAKQRYSTG